MLPKSESLLSRAIAVQRRAEVLIDQAAHPVTKDQIALVALAARDAHAWLKEPEIVPDPQRLQSVEETLTAQIKRLDHLEDLLRDHGPEAMPR